VDRRRDLHGSCRQPAPTAVGGKTNSVSAAGADTLAGESASVSSTDGSPQVAAVYVSGSAWAQSFKNYLASHDFGHSTYGFAVATGAEQLNELPWTNINRISATFTEDVSVSEFDLLVVGVDVPNYEVTGFTYDPATLTGTWSLGQALAPDLKDQDKVILHLTNFITDADGNRLDGEWTDAASNFPSGNGTADGVFQLKLDVITGDVNRTGGVGPTDYVQVRNRDGTNATTNPGTYPNYDYTVFHDIDASGTITKDLDESGAAPGDYANTYARVGNNDVTTEPVPPALPTVPSALTAVTISDIQIGLSWPDQPDELFYEVQRSTDGGGFWSHLGSSQADEPSYADPILQSNTRYDYRVSALNAAGQSGWSASAGTTTAPPAPADLFAAAAADKIDLTWDVSPAATSYNLHRTMPGVPFGDTPYQSGLSATSFSDRSLTGNTEYLYAVSAVNVHGQSMRSPRIHTATLPPPPMAVAAARSADEILVSWEYPVTTGVDFAVERHAFRPGAAGQQWTGSGYQPYERVATLDGAARTFRWDDVQDDTSYSFHVRARNVGGYSREAFAGAAVPPPAAPENLTVMGVFADSVNLTWADESINEDRFLVQYRRITESGPLDWSTPEFAAGTNATGCTFVGLFIYPVELRLIAARGGVYSAPSNIVTAVRGTVDNELPIVHFEASGQTVKAQEAGAAAVFTVRRYDQWGPITDGNLAVHLRLSGGEAVEAIDFTSIPRTVVIPDGSASVSFSVDAIDDPYFEKENAVVQIVAGGGYRGSGTVFLSISDNEGIDADVDSDNNSPGIPGGPDRSDSEDAVEDVPSDDARPGKVLLVNDADGDGDGIPGYADGYDLDPTTPADDADTEARFVPLSLKVSPDIGYDFNNAKLRISYPASDPATVEASRDEPYVLPPGLVRVWSLDGRLPRRASYHYLPPGEHRTGFGGLQLEVDEQAHGGPLTLFVEAVRPSAATGDIVVTVELDPTGSAGYVHRDSVRLTATRIEILGRGYEQIAFHEVSRFVTSDLSAAPQMGLTAGPFEVHKLRLRDPRTSGVTELFIDGQRLPVQRSGSFYETSEFVLVEPGAAQDWVVPYQKIVSDGPEAQISYEAPATGGVGIAANAAKGPRVPKTPKVRASKVLKVPQHFDELAGAIDDEIAFLKTDLNFTWKDQYPGTWEAGLGKEVHRRIASRAQFNQGRWMSDVYVRVDPNTGQTGDVLSVGNPPQGYPKADIQQVDAIYMAENGGRFAPGDVWDPSRVTTVHDIKNSIAGGLYGNQRARLLALTNNGEKLVVTTTGERCVNRKWIRNEESDARHWAFTPLGLGGTAFVVLGMYAMWDDFYAYYAQWQEVVQRSTTKPGSTMPWYEQSSVNMAQKHEDMKLLHSRMLDFMSHFVADDEPLDWLRVTLAYKDMRDYLNSVVSQ
jgi:hypothetical protein